MSDPTNPKRDPDQPPGTESPDDPPPSPPPPEPDPGQQGSIPVLPNDGGASSTR